MIEPEQLSMKTMIHQINLILLAIFVMWPHDEMFVGSKIDDYYLKL